MHAQFHIKIRPPEGPKAVIQLSGPITEKANFQGQWPPSEILKVEMDQLTMINSSGVRMFREWVHSLKYPRVEFSGCPAFLVNQINLIPELITPNVTISSFYVPFYSAGLDEEKMVLFRDGIEVQEKNSGLSLKIPEVADSAGRPMEMDVVSERYFAFVRRQRSLI